MQVYDLKKGDKILVDLYDTKTKCSWKEAVSYRGMDGMYARLQCKDGTVVNAYGEVKKQGEHYVFTKKE